MAQQQQRPAAAGGGGGGATRIGLIRCEHCGRQFNVHSGARHIPWCAKQQGENRKHRLSQEKKLALERYKWRISYKPSNRFQQPPQQQALFHNNDNTAAKKRSSVTNSSGTLSSPSASSTNSIGGSSSIGYAADGRHTTVHPRQQARVSVGPKASAALRRSISSLTLTKQRGTIEPVDNDSNSSHQPGRLRTKSTNDVSATSDMGEIVENLARRMEQIYAQNQMLLAKILARSADDRSATRSSTCSRPESDLASGSDVDSNDASQLSCHHCKSTCSALANYCHKCGCKLHTPTAESPG